MDEDTARQIQESLAKLLKQNEEMSEKITELQRENVEMKRQASSVAERVQKNKEKWVEASEQSVILMKELLTVKEELLADNVEEEYFENVELERLWMQFRNVGNDSHGEDVKPKIKIETLDEMVSGGQFNGTGKEERLDMTFGENGDCSVVSMRRFVERYKVVRELNMRARLTGWDSAEHRAGKLRLSLKGDAFDFVSLSSSMCEAWTMDDEKLIAKLKDKFINVQAIELNILNFEKCIQENKETLSEYQTRLQRLVKEAYDGDSQRELDRKVAWKFVSGVSDERVRRKMLENGWMKNRKESKSLEELLKLAEVTKRTEDAVRILGKETVTVNALSEEKNVASFNSNRTTPADRRERQKTNSSESTGSGSGSRKGSSSSSSDLPLDFLQCYYCNKSHRGGWLYCSKRKSENPNWRPTRSRFGSTSQKSRKDFR